MYQQPNSDQAQKGRITPALFADYIKQDFVKALTPMQLDAWDGITLAKVQLGANPEMLGVIFNTDTIFTMHTERVVDLETVYDGHHQKSRPYPGSLTFAPCQMPVTSRWNGPVQHFYCLLPQALWSRIAAEYTHRDPTRLSLAPCVDFRDPLSEHILWALQQEQKSGNAGGRLYVESLVQTLLLHRLVHASSLAPLHPLPTGHGFTTAQLRRVQEFIAANYERAIGLAELAAVIDFSPTYFTRQFKQSMGMAPHQFLTQVHVEQAKRLLEQGKLTIGEIAAQVGFYDQSHLAHHFKRIYGVAPKDLLLEAKMPMQ